MVTVYTMNNCQPCKMTKRELAKMNLEFEEVNLTEHPEALATLKEKGYASAPVVFAANGESWAGFNPAKLRKLANS